jgi:hypothetical protein
MLKIKCRLNVWDFLEVGFLMMARFGCFCWESFLKELRNIISIIILDIIRK